MNKEEFILSISERIKQLTARAHMKWYSTQTLQESVDDLRSTIVAYVETRPQYKIEMAEYLEAVNQLEKDIY